MLKNISVNFLEGNFFLKDDTRTNSEEQHACIKFERIIDEKKFRSLKEPFGTLEFDSYVRIGNIPIKSLTVFLLSATVVGDRLDVQLSPKNKYIEKLLHS